MKYLGKHLRARRDFEQLELGLAFTFARHILSDNLSVKQMMQTSLNAVKMSLLNSKRLASKTSECF